MRITRGLSCSTPPIPPSRCCPGAPTWAPLGSYSDACFDLGCGYTGWVSSTYTIPTGGIYYLKVGVVNWSDPLFDSGLAVDGVTIAGVPISSAPSPGAATPAPSSLVLTMLGLAALGIYVALKLRPVRT